MTKTRNLQILKNKLEIYKYSKINLKSTKISKLRVFLNSKINYEIFSFLSVVDKLNISAIVFFLLYSIKDYSERREKIIAKEGLKLINISKVFL